MDINRWWEGDPGEIYWLETTDRDDIGADLHTPQRDDRGREHHSYSQILEIRAEDVIFHYDKNQSAITSWSRASGEVFDTQILWGSHGAVTRRRGRGPYLRPGWSSALDGSHALTDVVSLEILRAHETEVLVERTRLEQSTKGSLYFPFALSELRPLRPTQFYLTKFPAGLVDVFPVLREAGAPSDPGIGIRPPATGGGWSPRQPNLALRQAVERAAQEAVEAMYRARGYEVEDVSHLNRGWDVEASNEDEGLRIEVKGRSGTVISAELTPNEFRRMQARDPSFRICIVTEALEPDRRLIHEFLLDAQRDAWVSPEGRELEVKVIEAARVGVR